MSNGSPLVAALRRAGLLRSPVAAFPSVTGIVTDSRQVVPGSIFVAMRGTQADGHRFVADAVARGAAVVVVEAPVDTPAAQLVVQDARRAAFVLARTWFDDPTAAMQLVGITGTNGKTTTTALVRHLLNRGGDAGSIGTLGAFDGAGRPLPSVAGSLTTPGPVDLQATFAVLRDAGVSRVAMETSSHSLDQGRLDGLVFHAAVFTNLTRDHLDYHGTMEHYLAAKLKLLTLLDGDAVVVTNADDAAWSSIPRGARRITVGFHPDADLRAAAPVLDAAGSRFRLEGRFGSREVTLPLPGEFNIYNALAAGAVALGLGESLDQVVVRLAGAPQVPGRMERIVSEPVAVLRDYAHTPDALERALETLRPLTLGRLIVLFGCGGDRDRGKRPLMGRTAGKLADLSIVTSDNPRTEEPEGILDDIIAGLPPSAEHRRIVDRRTAIGEALDLAKPGDTVLLAGKGHETYQILGKTSVPFDEKEIVRGLLGRSGEAR